MDYIFTVLDEKEDFVFPAELIAHFFDAFEGNLALGATIFSLEDVAWMEEGVPKQPEPMMRLML